MEETEEKGAVFETANTISGGKYFGRKNAAKYMLFFLGFSLFSLFFNGEVTSFKAIEVDKNIYVLCVMEKDLEKDLWVGKKKGILGKMFSNRVCVNCEGMLVDFHVYNCQFLLYNIYIYILRVDGYF